MDDRLTPIQRKRARLQAQKTIHNSPQSSADESKLLAAEDPEMDRLWEKWATEPAEPWILEAIEWDRAATATARQEDPTAEHVLARTPTNMTIHEARRKLLEALGKSERASHYSNSVEISAEVRESESSTDITHA